MEKRRNWVFIWFFIFIHLLVLIGVPLYLTLHGTSTAIIITTASLFILCGISITAGYHRFYSHKSYKLNKVMEMILLFFATLSIQGSALKWSLDHRMHHRHGDTELDPYSVTDGFWHAHMTWMFTKQNNRDFSNVQDLLKNKLVVFQDKYYAILAWSTNIVIGIGLGLLFNDVIGGIVMLLALRIVLGHHSTWFINSIAHTYGAKTYSQEQTAVDNAIIALLTFGEGYHNYHHVFEGDYRNGIRWWHYDPTKWLIQSLHWFGLTKGLRKTNDLLIKKVMVESEKHIFIQHIKDKVFEKTEFTEAKIRSLADSFSQKVSKVNELIHHYKESKKVKQGKIYLKNIKTKIRETKKLIKRDWAHWCRMSKRIARVKPIPDVI